MGGATARVNSEGAIKAAETTAEGQLKAAQVANQVYADQQARMQPWALSGSRNLAALNYAMYGITPSAEEMKLAPSSVEYKRYQAEQLGIKPGSHDYNEFMAGTPPDWVHSAKDRLYSGELYRNPLTGEITTTAPDMSTESLFSGVQSGELDPSRRFGLDDWYASPEYLAFNNARDAAVKRTNADLLAQAGASGLYGSGTFGNALAQNVGQLYAGYDTASLAAARDAWNSGRTMEYNMLAGLANPDATQQINTYAGAAGNVTANALANAAGIMGKGEQQAANATANSIKNTWMTGQDIWNYARSGTAS